LNFPKGIDKVSIYLSIYLSISGVAVAREVSVVVWQQEGCWFDPQDPPS